MKFDIPTWEVFVRLAVTVLLTGVIGFDREQRDHTAGMRTFILVGVGACIFAMIQKEIGFNMLNIAKEYPQLDHTVQADSAHLVAQVVAGVGFIGAGFIIVQRKDVLGLTSAATIWTVAGIGVAVGMGYYTIAIAGTLITFLILTFLKKILNIVRIKKISIRYEDKVDTKQFIKDYFDKKGVQIHEVNFSVDKSDKAHQIYTDVYQIDIPKDLSLSDIIEGLSINNNILQVKTVDI